MRPTAKELGDINEAMDSLILRIGGELEELGHPEVGAVAAGSVAKGTATRGLDLDVFLIFPKRSGREMLAEVGLEIGRRVLKDPRRKYTQHPYMTGRYSGYKADVVPCLDIDIGEKVQTAVDRSPHHTIYIKRTLDGEQVDEVRLLKSFLKGIGAYGAEDAVNGLSGYLVELLVLLQGDFGGVIDMFSRLSFEGSPPGGCEVVGADFGPAADPDVLVFDREPLVQEPPLEKGGYRSMFRNDAWIVVDPVDPRRNVASPVSAQTLAHIRRAASELIRSPSTLFFHPFSRRPNGSLPRPHLEPLSSGGSIPMKPGTELFAIPLPGGNPDVVTTQLRSGLRRSSAHLVRSGFRKAALSYLLLWGSEEEPDEGYLRSRTLWRCRDERNHILIRLDTEPGVLEDSYIHWGPPVGNSRGEDFRAKWEMRTEVEEKDGRLFVRLRRDVTDPSDILLAHWCGSSMGSAFDGLEFERVVGPVDLLLSAGSILGGNWAPWE